MKGVVLFLVIAATLFAAESSGAFVQPMVISDSVTVSGHQSGSYWTTANGSATQGADRGIAYKPIIPEQPTPAIPEPTTALLFGLGLVGAGCSRLRKRRS